MSGSSSCDGCSSTEEPMMYYAAWPPKRARWLNSEAMQAFRKSYRNYREGHWKGAKGEVFSVAAEKAKLVLSGRRTPEDGEPSSDNIREISIFEDVEDPEVIRHLQGLEHYRRAYRCFRLGEAKGAEGELSKYAQHFSSDQLRLLPVAALARCLADQVRQKGAVQPPDAKFHVHLGAGKLGLGLVVPAIVTAAVPFAILQRPSEPWHPVLHGTRTTVRIRINNDVLTTLYVIRSLDDLRTHGFVKPGKGLDELDKLTLPSRESPEAPFGMLVLDPTLEPLILRTADAFSCSLGAALKTSLSNLASYLPPNSGLFRPALYACENDHQAVDTIRGLLEQPLYVKECMVDRICSERDITADEIRVTTEPYPGEIIVTARFPEAIRPAFCGSNVRLPSTSGAYSYLYNRKFLLVNGTHTTLAFMTLRQCCHEPSEAPGDYELLDPQKLTSKEHEELLAWAAARCLVLLHSHEVAVVKFAHDVQRDDDVVSHLWNYAMSTMKRFSTVKDSTKRVLGGGVQNRYETRLKAILDTLEAFDKTAGFHSMGQLKTILGKLVRDAERFVSLGAPPERDGGSSRIVEGYQKQFRAM